MSCDVCACTFTLTFLMSFVIIIITKHRGSTWLTEQLPQDCVATVAVCNNLSYNSKEYV